MTLRDAPRTATGSALPLPLLAILARGTLPTLKPWEKGDLTSFRRRCVSVNGLNLMSFNMYYVLGILCPVCTIQLWFSIRLSEPRHAPGGMRAHTGLLPTGRGGGGGGREEGRGCPPGRHSRIPASCWLSKAPPQTKCCLPLPPAAREDEV